MAPRIEPTSSLTGLRSILIQAIGAASQRAQREGVPIKHADIYVDSASDTHKAIFGSIRASPVRPEAVASAFGGRAEFGFRGSQVR
jgi:hypothetical protein